MQIVTHNAFYVVQFFIIVLLTKLHRHLETNHYKDAKNQPADFFILKHNEHT